MIGMDRFGNATGGPCVVGSTSSSRPFGLRSCLDLDDKGRIERTKLVAVSVGIRNKAGAAAAQGPGKVRVPGNPIVGLITIDRRTQVGRVGGRDQAAAQLRLASPDDRRAMRPDPGVGVLRVPRRR